MRPAGREGPPEKGTGLPVFPGGTAANTTTSHHHETGAIRDRIAQQRRLEEHVRKSSPKRRGRPTKRCNTSPRCCSQAARPDGTAGRRRPGRCGGRAGQRGVSSQKPRTAEGPDFHRYARRRRVHPSSRMAEARRRRQLGAHQKVAPGNALAAVMGGPITCVDVDIRNGGDIEAVRNLLATLGVTVFAEIVTPGGGVHFYVAGHRDLPTVHSRSGDIPKLLGFPGVDIQSHGSNIYLPGTLRPRYNGRGYTIVFNNLEALDDGGDPDGAEALVGWVATNRDHKTPQFTTAPHWNGTPPDARQRAYLSAVIRNQAAQISAMEPDSGRNQAVYEAGLKCGNYVAGAGMDERLVRDTLEQAADACGLTADDGRNSVLATIQSGLTNGKARPRAVPTADESREDPGPTDADETDDDVRHSGHLGMAIKLGKQFGGKLRYVNRVGWHAWDEKRWAPDGDGAARRAVHAVIKRDRAIIKRLELSSEEEEKRLKQIARYETAGAISGILTEAAVLYPFSIEVAALDADPYLLNCANGTLDLRTMELRPHNPADLITKVTRAAYRSDTPTATWVAFLEEILPSRDVRDYLRLVIGVALLGKVVEHNLVIFNGKGRNGKGTLYQALCFALGDYADMADPEIFMERKGAHPTGDMTLLGLRLAVVSESGRDRALDEARMKRLTGGDLISARYLYKDQVTFTPSHLPLFVTNHLPKVSGDDEATWARLRVVPFNEEFDDDDEAQDKHLDEKLQTQADAILSWAVAGWCDYRDRGERLDAPPEVRVATDKYRTDSDDVGRFLADDGWVCKGDALKATTSQLHGGYLRWAKEEGGDEIGLKAFGAAMDSKRFPVTQRTKAGRWRDGLALRPREKGGDR